jgi:hypothetical protein
LETGREVGGGEIERDAAASSFSALPRLRNFGTLINSIMVFRAFET